MRLRDVDLCGQSFGLLRVLRLSSTTGKQRRWECRCDCGAIHVTSTAALRRGAVKSCGCLKRKTTPGRTHGQHGSPTYLSWFGMKRRCKGLDLNAPTYSAKGITYPAEWESFETFRADMGERPDGTSLDRINNALGYSKDNCRWATDRQQQRNRDSNRVIEWRGESYPLVALAEIRGMSSSALSSRLARGWTIDRAMATPPDITKGRKPVASAGRSLMLSHCTGACHQGRKACPRPSACNVTPEPEDLGDFQIVSRENALLALVIAFIVGVVLQRAGFI